MSSTLKTKVYRAICRRLANGQMPPGSRVSELGLSKELGVSRTPVREAVHQLAAEGLIQRVSNAVSYVSIPSRTELADLYEMREWLECEAAAKAARQIGQRELAELERACGELRSVAAEVRDLSAPLASGPLLYRFEAADAMFHLGLIRACGNRRVLQTLANQHLLSRAWGFAPQSYDLSTLARLYGEHARIMRVVRRGEVEVARELTRAHIRGGRKATLAVFDRQQHQLATSDQPEWPETLRHMLQQMEDHEASGNSMAEKIG